MPFNGSGVFVRVRNWVNDAAANIRIRADYHDSEDDNLASGLSQCITKDGQTTITSNLPMANYLHTGVGAATAITHYARYDQLQLGKAVWADAGGAADAITATYSPSTTTPVDGQLYFVRAGAANATTTPTFSPDGQTARTITKNGNTALAVGDIAADGHELILRYRLSDTKYELLNPAATSTNPLSTSTIQALTAGGIVIKNQAGNNIVTLGGSNTQNAQFDAIVTMGNPLGEASGGTNSATFYGAYNNIASAAYKDTVLNGLTMSNNVTDATNDIDVAAGSCVSGDGTTLMNLSAIIKRLDASWAVGTNQGGLDTGAISDAVYHVWVINRPDTNVTDVLFSLSATAPTMPANYTKKKCIGSIIRSAGAILLFNQYGNMFQFVAPVVDVNVTNPGTSATLRTLTVPPSLIANVNVLMANITSAAAGYHCLVNAVAQTDVAPTVANCTWSPNGTGNFNACSVDMWIPASSSSQIRTRQAISAGSDVLRIKTLGWRDTRI